MRQRVLTFALVVNGLLLPLGCVPTVFVLAAAMTLAFAAETRVTNATSRPIVVTPVGTTDGTDRVLLPTLVARYVPWPSTRQGEYRIAPGSSQTFVFDTDDVTLIAFVVRREGEPVSQFTTTPLPNVALPTTTRRDRAAPPSSFIVTTHALEPIDPVIGSVADRARGRSWTGLAMPILWLPWLTFGPLWRARRRTIKRDTIAARR